MAEEDKGMEGEREGGGLLCLVTGLRTGRLTEASEAAGRIRCKQLPHAVRSRPTLEIGTSQTTRPGGLERERGCRGGEEMWGVSGTYSPSLRPRGHQPDQKHWQGSGDKQLPRDHR